MLGTELMPGSGAATTSAVLDPESMHRPVFAIFLGCLALVGSACEEEPPPGFEEGSFGAENRGAIEDDCDRRVMCAQRNNPHLRSDVWENCVSENAQNLNRDEAFQFRWSLGIARCFQMDPCLYTECVDSTYQSWGQSQLPKIDNICRQKMQCGIDSNMLAVAPEKFYESCRIASVLSADALQMDVRITFTDAYFMCETMTSCAFQGCFPF